MTLIHASGRGPESLCEWARAWVCRPGLLQLDGRYVLRQSSLSFASECCEVKFLLPSNPSLWLPLVLLPTNSAWLLTSWSVQRAGSESWAMSGGVGAVGGGD